MTPRDADRPAAGVATPSVTPPRVALVHDWLTGMRGGEKVLEAIAAHEHDLLLYATERLREVPQVRLVGTARDKAGVVSFLIDGIHAHDIGTILDREGIAVRTGHHCAQPVMQRYGIPATTRASFAMYNTRAEVDALVAGIHKVLEVFA